MNIAKEIMEIQDLFERYDACNRISIFEDDGVQCSTTFTFPDDSKIYYTELENKFVVII